MDTLTIDKVSHVIFWLLLWKIAHPKKEGGLTIEFMMQNLITPMLLSEKELTEIIDRLCKNGLLVTISDKRGKKKYMLKDRRFVSLIQPKL